MLSPLRSALRPSTALLRATFRASYVHRSSLSTRAHAPRNLCAAGAAAATLAVSGILAFSNAIRLDALDDGKVTPKANAKKNAKQGAQVERVEGSFIHDHDAKNIVHTETTEDAFDEGGGGDDANAVSGESGGGGAFNPETGEINWDCPCLGGMAHGPCGQEFRDAFSCFVYSQEEPKGINCVEKFKAMQDCFRKHPDVYGEEIMADDDDDDGSPSGTDSPGLQDETLPDPNPIATPTPDIVSPSS